MTRREVGKIGRILGCLPVCCILFCCTSVSEVNPVGNVQMYSGIGYVSGLESLGASISVRVSVPYRREYALKVCCRNIGTAESTLTVKINGFFKSYLFVPATKSEEWDYVEIPIVLDEGNNDLSFVRESMDSGLLEIDHIEFCPYDL